MIKVILTENIPGQGVKGDIINVSDGFARNYLIPQGKAIIATADSIQKIEEEQKKRSDQEKKLLAEHESQKLKLEQLSLQIKKKAKNDKLFGSVTASEIAEALKEKGINVKPKNIKINNPIKSIGKHKVGIVLDKYNQAALWLQVVGE